MAKLSFLLLLLLLHFLTTPMGLPIHKCEGDNYTANSPFGTNLERLLASLSSSNLTYTTEEEGASPDRTYGLVLCRGDLDPSSCTTCYENMSRNVTELCAYSKSAVIWDPNCLLRYSHMLFFTSMDPEVVDVVFDNETTAPDSDTFCNMSRMLSEKVSHQAAYNSASLLFSTGSLSYSGGSSSTSIYSLAQCTRDLSADRCSQCLQKVLQSYWGFCQAHMGGWYVARSCNYRDGVQKFYRGDPSVALTLPLESSPPTKTPTSPVSPTPTKQDPSPRREGKKKNTGKVLAICISLAVALVLSFLFYICFRKRRSAKNTTGKSKMEEILNMESLLFDLSMLKDATDNFGDSNKLGQGGFGTVYKGILPDGQEIAVKRLSATSRQGLEELRNELLLVARLQHKNLVRLRGVCLQKEEQLLVYEYVPNRSLDTFLFDPIKCKQLNWPRRFEIIRGIARGLRYLHEESHLKVIHRDLKASNVLLDAELNPKIADFGMARLFGVDQTQNTTSRVVGTFGYMAPEYAMRGQFSVKLDVFSFGILVLEIVTGRKSSSFGDSGHDQDLISYTWEHWSEDKGLDIVDPSLGERFSRNEVLRCIQVGLLCVQDVPAKRPLMSSTILMLDSPTTTLQAPVQPTLGARISWMSDCTDKSSSESRSIVSSVNDVTISELHPR